MSFESFSCMMPSLVLLADCLYSEPLMITCTQISKWPVNVENDRTCALLLVGLKNLQIYF